VKKTFECPICNTPIAIPPFVQAITFPDDSDTIIDVLEARLNVATCGVCGTGTPVLVSVLAVNPTANSAIAIVFEGSGDEEELCRIAGDEYELKIGRNYYDLYQFMRPWLNSYLLPIANSLLSGKYAELPREQQVELFTPLFIRIFKGHIDGKIDIEFQVSGNIDSQKAKDLITEIYSSMVGEQLHRLALEAARTKTMAALPQVIDQRIPKSCITPEVLDNVIRRCHPWQDPYDDPNKFMIGFRQEYLNALAHAHADTLNPRRETWIQYLFSIWALGKDERVFLDPQFRLPTVTVASTVRFRDLWDTVGASLLNGAHKTNDHEKLFRDVADFFQHSGFENEFAQALESGGYRVTGADDETAKGVVDEIERGLLCRFRFNESATVSTDVGRVVAGSVNFLLQSSLNNAALELLRRLLASARKNGDETAQLAIVAYSVEYLNVYELYQCSSEIIPDAIRIATQNADTLDRDLLIHFWNEVGNTFRYQHLYERALTAYEIVGALLEAQPKTDVIIKNISTLNRNLGIVYRNSGKYSKALTLLRNEVAKNPTDPELQHNMASMYLHLNRYEEALQFLNKAIELSPGSINSRARANYLISRAWLREELGDFSSGFEDLMQAADLTETQDTHRRNRIALLALMFKKVPPKGRSFLESCKDLIVRSINSLEMEQTPLALAAIVANLAMFLLRNGNVEEANSIVRPKWEWLSSQWELSWEMDHAIAWLEYLRGDYARCWPLIQTAMRKIDEDVPSLKEASFAESWMSDKEELQGNIASMTLGLIDEGIVGAEELGPLYEFMNGKEIAARLRSSGPMQQVMASQLRGSSRVKLPAIKVFFFIETDTTIRLAVKSKATDKTDVIKDVFLDRKQILEIREKTRTAFAAANPADLSVVDAELKEWNELGKHLGDSVAKYLNEEDYVCFLPGRTLTGLPLHLMLLPDGRPLIESHAVSYAPNQTVLFAENDGSGNGKSATATVVTVTKKHDSEAFRIRALQASDRIVSALQKAFTVQWIKQEQADRVAIRQSLTDSDAVIFVCHGTTAGLEKGHGICIADGGDLPPTLLPVLDFPDLSRFVLTWQDINDLERSAATVISIACSSGWTNIGGGGVRYGLEQSLFGSGTRTIISPLWDVDQASALTWLQYFVLERSINPQSNLARVFRLTCLRVKKEHPHPFFWAPFILNGSFS
jgi:tetratricopeptide (TPR) repeat protein/CHAT domain-containing protein